MLKVLNSSTTIREWLEILVDEIGILDKPEQIAVGEAYTLLTHRDELQSALEDSEIPEAVRQQVEEIDRRMLEKAEVIINAENLPRRREQRSRERGISTPAWWWHLDEIFDGLRYLKQVPERTREKALVVLLSEYTQVIEKPLPSVREEKETYVEYWLTKFLVPSWRYVSTIEFVDFWETLYPTSFRSEEDYRLAEECYSRNVKGVEEITEENVRALFRWQLGQDWEKASWKRKSAFQKAIDNLERLNEFKHLQRVTDAQVEGFLRFLSGITSGRIYKPFFFHICRPLEFALYDQHVYRGWQFLIHLEVKEVPDDFEAYKQYNRFFAEHAQRMDSDDQWEARRRLDKALMAFGKFLKRNAQVLQSKETKL
jgi:hypothetical protein